MTVEFLSYRTLIVKYAAEFDKMVKIKESLDDY